MEWERVLGLRYPRASVQVSETWLNEGNSCLWWAGHGTMEKLPAGCRATEGGRLGRPGLHTGGWVESPKAGLSGFHWLSSSGHPRGGLWRRSNLTAVIGLLPWLHPYNERTPTCTMGPPGKTALPLEPSSHLVCLSRRELNGVISEGFLCTDSKNGLMYDLEIGLLALMPGTWPVEGWHLLQNTPWKMYIIF